MVSRIARYKSTIFLACLMLLLSSCTLGNSSTDLNSNDTSSNTSTGTATSGTGENTSSGISGSDSSSVEIPDPGETISGSSANWPKAIIETIFTSVSRLTIPAFVSSAPYAYEYMASPDPHISIATTSALNNSVAAYQTQLENAGWTVHPEYQLVMMYNVAVDANEEMMIFFMADEQNFIIEISNYYEEAFGNFDIEQSAVWPQDVIDAYLGFSSASALPVFASSNPYFYIASTGEDEAMVVFTQVPGPSAVSDYITLLGQEGWTSFESGEYLFYVDPSQRIILIVDYEAGFARIIIIKNGGEEPEMYESPTWPSAAIDEFLTITYLKMQIPAFSAARYFYFTDEDEYSPFMTIMSASDGTKTNAYITELVTIGWEVTQTHPNAGYGFYAIDNEFEVILIIEEYNSTFVLEIHQYRSMLESYLETGLGSWKSSSRWPETAIGEVLSETPATPLPAFESNYYLYRQESDKYGPYLAMTAYAEAGSDLAYKSVLEASSYTVKNQDISGTLYYVAYDPDQKVMLYYYYAEGVMFIIVRDYNGDIGGDPQYPEPDTWVWPTDVLTSEFGATLAGLIPTFETSNGYNLSYDDLDEYNYINITALGASEVNFEDYLNLLASQQFEVTFAAGIAGENYNPYVAIDSERQILILLSLGYFGVDIEVMLYDEDTYQAMITGDSTAPIWPDSELYAMFDGYTVPAYGFNEGETLSYNVDDINNLITITIGNCGPEALANYIAILNENNYRIYVNYDSNMAIATNPSGNITIDIAFAEKNLTLDVKFIDYEAYEVYYSTYIETTSNVFPNELIDMLLGSSLPNLLLPYVSEAPFTYCANWFNGNPRVDIEVASSILEFENYYNALSNGGWTIDGSVSAGNFVATQANYDGYVEVNYDEATSLVTIIVGVAVIK